MRWERGGERRQTCAAPLKSYTDRLWPKDKEGGYTNLGAIIQGRYYGNGKFLLRVFITVYNVYYRF
jgi:hypothetical protein